MSLFGNTQSSFGGQQSSSSLFGQSGSLFGASNPTSSVAGFGASSTGGSMFGGPTNSTSLFSNPASSASLFGAPASSGSLFGAPASSSSLFGGNTGSLFGNTAGSSSSLFGAPQSAPSLFGSNPIPNQQQPQQQEQSIEVPGRTRISQLPEKLQKDMFAIESHLREQRSRASQLLGKHTEYDSKLKQVGSNTTTVSRAIVKLRAEIEALQGNATALKAAVRNERSSAEPVVIALDNLSRKKNDDRLLNGTSNRYGGFGIRQHYNCHIPEDYFEKTLYDLETRAHGYKAEIDEIAEFLKAQGVGFTTSSNPFSNTPSGQDGIGAVQLGLLDNISKRHYEAGLMRSDYNNGSQGKTIEEIIRRQYEYFMVVASHIAGVHESLRVLREQFLSILRARNPDCMDPFRQADIKEKAEKERSRILAEQQASKKGLGPISLPNTQTAPSTSTAAATTQGSLTQNFGSNFGTGLFGGGSNSNDPNANDASSRKKRTF